MSYEAVRKWGIVSLQKSVPIIECIYSGPIRVKVLMDQWHCDMWTRR